MHPSLIFNYCEENKRNLFLFLVLFHIICSLSLYGIAHTEILSGLHNGNGFWSFAGDSVKYHVEAIESFFYLQESRWTEWWNLYPGHRHVSIISLLYWITDYQDPITFEILNSIMWATSVMLVYKTSLLLFINNNKVALITTLFFFQPSVLISSTQLLRDPILILGFCLVIHYSVRILKQNSSKVSMIFIIQIGLLLMLSIRDYLTIILLVGIIFFGLIALFHRKISIVHLLILLTPMIIFQSISINSYLNLPSLEQVQTEKEKNKAKIKARYEIFLLKGGDIDPPIYNYDILKHEAAITLRNNERTRLSDEYFKKLIASEPKNQSKIEFFLNDAARKLSLLRFNFELINSTSQYQSGSNIDNNMHFRNLNDLLSYLPRAIQVGFFSPFPSSWTQKSSVTGKVGKVLSSLETAFWYLVLVGFTYFMIKAPYQLVPLLPFFIVSIITIILLSYVIPNVGTIYRLRQPFFIPFYIFGVYGLSLIFSSFNKIKMR